MIIGAENIRRKMRRGPTPAIDCLAIVPILDWGAQAKPGSSSIDVRLGQKFKVPRRARLDSLDHMSSDHVLRARLYNDEVRVPIGDYFVLHPRQFVLGETLEWIRLPRGLNGLVSGRSSWGRDGLIVATATGVHPGYAGVLALEITNLGEVPLRLYPGVTIAQLFLHEVDQPADTPLSSSVHMASAYPRNVDAIGETQRRIITQFARSRSGVMTPSRHDRFMRQLKRLQELRENRIPSKRS